MHELKILTGGLMALSMSLAAGNATAAAVVSVDSVTGCSLISAQGFSSGRLGFFKSINNLGPCDVIITVSGMTAGGAFDFEIAEAVRNDSAFSWHDFHHSLGYRRNGRFTQSGSNDGVYFSVNPPKTGEHFTLSGQDDPTQANALDWLVSGAEFANDGTEFNDFHFGLHIADVDEFGVADSDGITTFTLRQQATVLPEPGALSLWLVVSGAALMASRRCRR